MGRFPTRDIVDERRKHAGCDHWGALEQRDGRTKSYAIAQQCRFKRAPWLTPCSAAASFRSLRSPPPDASHQCLDQSYDIEAYLAVLKLYVVDLTVACAVAILRLRRAFFGDRLCRAARAAPMGT